MDPLSKSENIKTLIRVSMFRPVIYCDDSGSMLKDDRQKAQADLVERIARITTRLVPEGEGVELRFINKSADDLSGLDEKGIRERMNELKITPGSYTQIGIGLKEKILKPLVYEPLESKEGLTRPLLVCIITDGYPQNPPTVGPVAGLNREQPETTKNNIDECGEKLDRAEYPRSSVRFLVNQIGKSDKAREFLEDLGNDTRLSDVVHVTTDMLDDKWKELRDNKQHLEEWLLQTLLAPIVNKGPD
ncbi:hypothetical protein NUW58_g8980 [Xylaria curta]|uniref:Uncharacterized protein n=1 Tax=Xylaria curta TaxID=42375 RepID=A0ACC1N491_9PEZI|nr:hypothetical protein NUW58_g8980 [Xylaria curta]